MSQQYAFHRPECIRRMIMRAEEFTRITRCSVVKEKQNKYNLINRANVLLNYSKTASPATSLRHVDEGVDVVVVSSHILVLDQPLELLLDHFLRR